MISLEDWALIRRLVADGVSQRQVARELGIARDTVAAAVRSDRPPKYERPPVQTSFSPFEARVRALLAEHPSMPATVIAERVEWSGSITWFRDNVRRLRPEHRPVDPAGSTASSVFKPQTGSHPRNHAGGHLPDDSARHTLQTR
ncbi:helix-turn-helix domain-containing protein [Microbacterium sp.]|uniref:helix-turn-helix domain-containing protein n=1 Tax=Microbacterium sp. TaxID=51671 RepID=UPI0037CB548C